MKYLFLNSYFNSIEKHIADQVDFDRMINAKDESKAYEVLQDTDYGRWALETENLETVFEKEKSFFSEELSRMGVGSLVDLYRLRADIVNLRIFLKNKLFNLDSGDLLDWGKSKEELVKEYQDEISTAKSKDTPAKLDDYLTEVYLDRLEEFATESKEVKQFIESYKDILDEYEGEIKDKKIKKLEDEFISENTRKNEGLAPVFAFFMKKWRAEKIIRTIITGKEIEFSPKKIRNLVEDLRSI
ncbi:MAG: hypothetical protein ACQEP3_01875 [Patescibacteria group bacterium]